MNVLYSLTKRIGRRASRRPLLVRLPNGALFLHRIILRENPDSNISARSRRRRQLHGHFARRGRLQEMVVRGLYSSKGELEEEMKATIAIFVKLDVKRSNGQMRVPNFPVQCGQRMSLSQNSRSMLTKTQNLMMSAHLGLSARPAERDYTKFEIFFKVRQHTTLHAAIVIEPVYNFNLSAYGARLSAENGSSLLCTVPPSSSKPKFPKSTSSRN